MGGGAFTKIELNLINKLNLSNNIECFNFATEEDLVMFYNCAESFIYPSLSEGFGLPLIEAMACGTAVLASDIPVFHEVALDIAYYFNPYNNESIIKALNDSLIENPDRIKKGIELSKKFTWKNTAKETLKIYENILKDKYNEDNANINK